MKTIPLPIKDLNWYHEGILVTILIPNLYQANTDNNLIVILQTLPTDLWFKNYNLWLYFQSIYKI